MNEDPSNGYEAVAAHFVCARRAAIGEREVRQWARTLGPGAAVLDLGCGHGVPVTQALLEEGLRVTGVDASPALLAEYRSRFPGLDTECARVETAKTLTRQFDAIVAWGLIFLLESKAQELMISRVAGALAPGGRFLFTAPEQKVSWQDALTGRESFSLGRARYAELLAASGMSLLAEFEDAGQNHYYSAQRV